jgi:hypothetical protein
LVKICMPAQAPRFGRLLGNPALTSRDSQAQPSQATDPRREASALNKGLLACARVATKATALLIVYPLPRPKNHPAVTFDANAYLKKTYSNSAARDTPLKCWQRILHNRQSFANPSNLTKSGRPPADHLDSGPTPRIGAHGLAP